MVAVTATMTSWLPSSSKNNTNTSTRKNKTKENENNNNNKPTKYYSFFWNLLYTHQDDAYENKPKTLGILAFDATKTIANLIFLYRSLSEAEITLLRRHVIVSRGVSYLNSEDQGFLLALACAERLEDLDRAAGSVARLGAKCSGDSFLSRFDLVYRHLKLGHVHDLHKLCKEVDHSLHKTEKLIGATADLYEELETLSQLEASERRLNEWKHSVAAAESAAEAEAFEQKIVAQRKLVRRLKESSMWSQPYDKTVGLAARVVCAAYARICAHFGPYVAVLPQVRSTSRRTRSCKGHSYQTTFQDPGMIDKLFDGPELLRLSHSGPIVGSGSNNNMKASLVRFLSSDSNVFLSEQVATATRATVFSGRHKNRVFQAAPPTTVGGSGLAVRYAKLIRLAERYLRSECTIGEQAREELYDMLPASLRAQVRSKLKKSWREVEEDARRDDGGALAAGWREAVEEILRWLGPMAQDTLTWQSERSLEGKAKRLDAQAPTVLLLQTLHFSDLEKVEAAVAEVLVGLSCVCRYQNRPAVDGDGYRL